MAGRSDLPERDAAGDQDADPFDEGLRRGRVAAKRAFWGMLIAAAVVVLVGGMLGRWVIVGIVLLGFSYPLVKVLREYRHPREFAKPRYWDTVTRVLERHGDAAAAPAHPEESAVQRRLRIQGEMDQIRRLGPKPKSRGGDTLWPSVLLTLVAATAGTLYLVPGRNTSAAVAWYCMAGFVAGLGWLRKTMRGKERKAFGLLEEELEELGGGPVSPGEGSEGKADRRRRRIEVEDDDVPSHDQDG